MDNSEREATYRALISMDLGYPFPAKHNGVCALTGIEFYAGAKIRRVGNAYCLQRGLELACVAGQAPYEAQMERTSPFDFERLERWLADGSTVHVYSRNGALKTYRAGGCTGAQLRVRTRAAAWMIR